MCRIYVTALIFAMVFGSFTAVRAQEEPPPDNGGGEVEVAATGESGSIHVGSDVEIERQLGNMNWNGWNAFGWTPVKRRHAGNDNFVGRARVWVSQSAANSGWLFSLFLCEDLRFDRDRCMHSGIFNPDYRANWWTIEGHPRYIRCVNPNGTSKDKYYSRVQVRENTINGPEYKPAVAESTNINTPLRCRST